MNFQVLCKTKIRKIIKYLAMNVISYHIEYKSCKVLRKNLLKFYPNSSIHLHGDANK